MSRTITPVLADRPYILTFANSGSAFLISADEARRLVANYPVLAMSAGRLTLRSDDGSRTFITPATLGGGPAFTRAR